jgi:hypothetical protein
MIGREALKLLRTYNIENSEQIKLPIFISQLKESWAKARTISRAKHSSGTAGNRRG